MATNKNYYQKIKEGYPFWMAEGRTLEGYIKHLACQRKRRRVTKKNNGIAVKKYEDKMRSLYGGKLDKPEARMRWEYAKGVVDLGTKEVQ